MLVSRPLYSVLDFALLTAENLSNDTLKARLKPLHRIVLADLMLLPHTTIAPPSPRHPCPRPRHTAVEVHPVNTNRRIVLNPQIDMFRDPEPEVARVAEVLLAELVFFDFEAALEDFFGFGAADGNVHGDLLVAPDAEGADGVAGFACINGSASRVGVWKALCWSHVRREGWILRTVDRSLTRQLLQHLRSTGQSIARLADGDVENELVDAQLSHGVGALVCAFRHLVYQMMGLTIETELWLCEMLWIGVRS
jgi:hypothetical protein